MEPAAPRVELVVSTVLTNGVEECVVLLVKEKKKEAPKQKCLCLENFLLD